MCGIFGFVTRNGTGPNLKTLADIARATETRGAHAFGLAWIDARGRLRCYKQTGRISCRLGVLRMAADAKLLIGHCRYATHGDPRDNLNNHPHPCDGGWLVHNGVIRRCREIARQWGLHPVSECDSEVLALLVETLDGESPLERCIEAAGVCKSGPLAMMALWKPGELVAVRSGNPLHLAETREAYYLASLAQGMPAGAYAVRDNAALHFTVGETTTLTAYEAAELETLFSCNEGD